MSFYSRFKALGIDLAPLGLEDRADNSPYFCTPRGAEIFGWLGVDGIHFCFISGFGETVFAVSPMESPNYVSPVAEDLRTFLRLLLSCRHASVIEQASHIGRNAFYTLINNEKPAPDAQNILDKLSRELGLMPMADPYEYMKTLRTGFDPEQIKYSEGPGQLDDGSGMPEPEWQVFFESGFMWHTGRAHAGHEIPLDHRFDWAGHQWYIPAVYRCGKGIVIDMCISVPKDRIKAFADKWGLEEDDDGSRFTGEELSAIQAENPLHIEFTPKIGLNSKTFEACHGCAVSYSPLFPGSNDQETMYVMRHYHLDPDMGWIVWRYCFRWLNRMEVRSLRLELSQDPYTVPGPSFSVSKPGDSFSFTLPDNKEPHTLTVVDIRAEKFSALLRFSGWEYPSDFYMMSYRLDPPPAPGLITISDSCRGDTPKAAAADDASSANDASVIGIIGGADGPTAISAAVCGGTEEERIEAACSSAYFALPPSPGDIVWRIGFHRTDFEPTEQKLI